MLQKIKKRELEFIIPIISFFAIISHKLFRVLTKP